MSREQDANDRTAIERVDPLIGSVLDRRYRIDFRLAAGGFGAIYRATHVKSGHEVALKVLHPQLASDAGVVARFRREGATMTTLRSPHTITAYELGEAEDGTLYIVMELLRGESLFERFRAHGRIEWKRAVKIMRAICHSLQEAHHLGIVHRDLKPTNIHLEHVGNDPDFVKVLDFGIAKILRDSDFDSSDLTNAGQMIGTIDYMSPEQMVGSASSGQSDIYTLGIVAYEMIAGVRPFAEAKNAGAALAAILKTTPPRLSTRVPVPVELDRILARCLERDPLKRYPDVVALGEDLDRLVGGNELDDVTRTVAMDGPGGIEDSTRPPKIAAEETAETRTDLDRTAFSTHTPSVEIDDRTVLSTDEPPTLEVAPPAKAASAPKTAPPYRRAATPPPVMLPSASPFKTTLPGAGHTPPPVLRPLPQPLPASSSPPYAAGYRPAQPAPQAGGYPPQPYPPQGYPHAPPQPHLLSTSDAAARRYIWIVVLIAGALVGILFATQL